MENGSAVARARRLAAIEDLLDPNVRWGAPDDEAPGGQNRRPVLAWYRRGRNAGVRARVTELATNVDQVLAGLRVVGRAVTAAPGGAQSDGRC